MTCELLKTRRSNLEPVAAEATSQFADVKATYGQCVQDLLGRRRSAEDDRLFVDRERLTEAIIGVIDKTGAMRADEIGGDSALAVFAERLTRLPDPELHLLAGAVIHQDASAAAERWLAAFRRPTKCRAARNTEVRVDTANAQCCMTALSLHL